MQFHALHLRQEGLLDILGESAPERDWYQAAGFDRFAGYAPVRGSRGNQPAVHILLQQERAKSIELREIRIFADKRVDHGEETGESRGAKTLEGKRRLRILRRVETNGQKQRGQGLKFVEAPAQEGSIRLKENKVTALGNDANKMANPRMNQGLASANPNHRDGMLD
jgi:hypothetical protein